jgi:hypothetical protein
MVLGRRKTLIFADSKRKICVSPALAGGARVSMNQRPDFESVR